MSGIPGESYVKKAWQNTEDFKTVTENADLLLWNKGIPIMRRGEIYRVPDSRQLTHIEYFHISHCFGVTALLKVAYLHKEDIPRWSELGEENTKSQASVERYIGVKNCNTLSKNMRGGLGCVQFELRLISDEDVIRRATLKDIIDAIGLRDVKDLSVGEDSKMDLHRLGELFYR